LAAPLAWSRSFLQRNQDVSYVPAMPDSPTPHAPTPDSPASTRIAIVPAFNESTSIAGVIRELRDHQPSFLIAVVDDGSKDDTIDVAAASGAVVLPLPFNLGIGGAVQAGFLYARDGRFDVAVQVDGDGQHDPAQIATILAPIEAGAADVVVGSRYLDGGTFDHAVHRRFLINTFARVVTAATGKRFTDTSSSFRAYNRKAIAICAEDYPQGFLESVESLVVLSRYGLRIVEVPVTIRQRSSGSTSLSLGRTMAYTIKVSIAIAMGIMRRAPETKGD
jgi:glycosyltransferase involved in cell wall biosynthesis